jgi:Arc/MetJ family transcription regulator
MNPKNEQLDPHRRHSAHEEMLAYNAAWGRYVKAPGEREEARRELIKAREAYDKAWREMFKPKATQ